MRSVKPGSSDSVCAKAIAGIRSSIKEKSFRYIKHDMTIIIIVMLEAFSKVREFFI